MLIYKPFGVAISKEVADKLYEEYKFKKISWIHRENKDDEFKTEQLNNIQNTSFPHILGEKSEVVLNISSWGKAELIMPPYKVSDDLWYFSNEEYRGFKSSETTSDIAAFLFENIISLVGDATALSLLREMSDNSPDLAIFIIKNKRDLSILSVDGYKKMETKDGIVYSNLKFMEKKTSWPARDSTPTDGYHQLHSPQNHQSVPAGKGKGTASKYNEETRKSIINNILLYAGAFVSGAKDQGKIYKTAMDHFSSQDDVYLENCLECYGLRIVG